jgi:hypothetical protein
MATRLKNFKTKHKKLFSIIDKGNLINIQQPDIVDVALLYVVLLEKTNKTKYY